LNASALKHLKRPKIEEERRREGLETKLDERNKGFAMLQKMGYKAGEKLKHIYVGCHCKLYREVAYID